MIKAKRISKVAVLGLSLSMIGSWPLLAEAGGPNMPRHLGGSHMEGGPHMLPPFGFMPPAGGMMREPSVEMVLARLSKDLKLDSAARIKVFGVLESGQQSENSLKDKLFELKHELHLLSPSDEEYMRKVGENAGEQADIVEQLVGIEAKNRATLFSVLTSDQQAKFLELEKLGPPMPGKYKGDHVRQPVNRQEKTEEKS